MGYFRPLSQTKFINDANLVSYWKLEDLTDSKGSNTLTNNNSVAFNPAKFDNGADFGASNTNKSLSVADHASLDITGSLSYSCWVNVTTQVPTNGNYAFGGKTAGGSQRSWWCDYQDLSGTKTIRLNISSNGSSSVSKEVPYTFTTGIWTHLVFVYDTSTTTVKIYVNGVQQGTTQTSAPASIFNSTASFEIGAIHTGTIYFFSGLEDDVGLFSRALSAGEVAELYQSMTLGEYLPNSSTKLLLHLNGSSADSSGNNNNGTDTAITYSQANGKFGQGAGFNGSTSKIVKLTDIGISNSVITMSCWFNIASQPSSGSFYQCVSHDSSVNDVNEGIFYGNNSGTYIVGIDRTRQGIAANSLLVNLSGALTGWNNLIGVFNGTTMVLYLNGAFMGTQAASGNGSSGGVDDTSVGCSDFNVTSYNHLNGSIDEVIVEARAWSASEVKKYYTMSKGRFGII